MDREAFLARVRTAAQAGRTYRIAHQTIPAAAGYVGATGDLGECFAREVNAVGGVAQIVASDEHAQSALAALLDQYQVRSALCWEHPVVERIAHPVLARRSLPRQGYSSLRHLPASEQRHAILAAGMGITSVEFAIAETGTLVMWSQPGQERVASLVPPVHVALVDESQLVPDLFDVFHRLHERGIDALPSNLALITGPSKTGDIELELTTGVHGPKHWHVIVIRREVAAT